MLLAESITLGGVFRQLCCFLYSDLTFPINQRAQAHFSTFELEVSVFVTVSCLKIRAPITIIRQQAVYPKIEKTALHK